MACSVYAAQYLLEGLFQHDRSDAALALVTAPGERSWKHMLDSGTTITWEAWDQKFKPNQDWNHAWGAAPANLLPRFILGVQALTPGWSRAVIRPFPGTLKQAEGKVPTPRGAVHAGPADKAAEPQALLLAGHREQVGGELPPEDLRDALGRIQSCAAHDEFADRADEHDAGEHANHAHVEAHVAVEDVAELVADHALQLLAVQLSRMKDNGTMLPEQVSLAKMNNVDIALEIARVARDIHGLSTGRLPSR